MKTPRKHSPKKTVQVLGPTHRRIKRMSRKHGLKDYAVVERATAELEKKIG